MTSIFAVLVLAACGGGSSTKAEETKEDAMIEEPVVTAYMLSTDLSRFYWLGEVAGVYGDDGYINVSEGNV